MQYGFWSYLKIFILFGDDKVMKYEYIPVGVCPTKITFELNDTIVSKVKFKGGCNGNLKALSKVINGMTVKEIVKKFGGIHCGKRPTSCTDQLAKAVKQAYMEYKNSNTWKTRLSIN